MSVLGRELNDLVYQTDIGSSLSLRLSDNLWVASLVRLDWRYQLDYEDSPAILRSQWMRSIISGGCKLCVGRVVLW